MLDNRLTTASTSDGISLCVRTEVGGLELSSSGPLVCEAVVVLVVAGAGGGGGWFSLEIAAATCCTKAEISSVVSGRVHVSVLGVVFSAGERAPGLSRWLRRVDGRPEVAQA